MNDLAVIGLEVTIVAVGLALLLLDLWTPAAQKRYLGYVAAAAAFLTFLGSFAVLLPEARTAFGGMYALDEFSLFFKRFFLLASTVVLVMSVTYSERFESGMVEYYALVLFATAGMMFAASANDFSLLFVSVELITVTFYVLTSFHRRRVGSIEAGVKYLILGALSSGFLVYGIALVYGASGTLSFAVLAKASPAVQASKLLMVGMLLVLVGLAFKIAAVPFQIWAPDVYQGAPSPTTAFLATGSKAAGLVLLLRVLHLTVPSITLGWSTLLMVVAGATILYGNLCAIPQRNLKRLMGYSSISHAGYLLLGVSALSSRGAAAVLYYLGGYLFTVLAAFCVICLVLGETEGEEIDKLAGLHRRSPFLAAALGLSMVSLAGVPPLAGFFGKFLLIQSLLAESSHHSGTFLLAGVAIVGVVISLYYYFAVIKAIYWPAEVKDLSPIAVPMPLRVALLLCIGGMLWLGMFPNSIVNLSEHAVAALHL